MNTTRRRRENEMMAVQHKPTLVVGLGVTGLATARFLASRGQDVRVIDSRANPPGLAALRRSHPEIPVALETLDPRWLEGVGEVVLSPGLGLDTPIAAEVRRRNIPLLSDIELFARSATAPVLAVTGSNGKSTVVTLLQRVLAASGLDVAAGGNLGPPALELLDEDVAAYVLEVSSFQLESTKSLRPLAATVLNISPDHLDRHGTLEHYAALKARLLQAADTAVFNWDDEWVRPMGLAHPQSIPFSVSETLESGYSVVIRDDGRWLARDREPLLAVAALRLRGAHNEANALAALALAHVLNRDLGPQIDALKSFSGLPHRCQWVAEHAGITFINDSKATNVGATVAALRGLPGPFVLIAGGQSKGADFSPLAEGARGGLRGAVLIGEAGDELEAVLTDVCPLRRANGMASAVALARELASPGDTVLLSPACASFDMFTDYAHRGERFVAAVRELHE
jgi:UDP-N-acetylmuramoylalanine--D-glutamate ligase